jgi:hypothetical protein
MTWIIGMPTLFGSSIGISDICVTIAHGREFDCLRKIYRVGPDIALGFAGSANLLVTILVTNCSRGKQTRTYKTVI